MIEFIGNYNESMPKTWIEHMNNNTGEVRPNRRMVMTPEVEKQQELWKSAGYDHNNPNISWELFHDWDFTEQLNIESFDFCAGKKIQWWVAKLKPGHCFPIHTDTIKSDLINPKRYWIALDDYKWGHTFLISDTCLRDYKRGDVFLFDNSPHGAANVGLVNKYSLQLLVSD